MPENAKRDRYHHGALRTALIESSIELLAERGIQGFSIAEVSRRLGVAPAAPYRHFADRDELLAAVAVRASEFLHERLARATATGSAPERLAAAAREYVHFSIDERSLFQALFAAGLDKSQHPDLQLAAQTVGAVFLTPAMTVCEGDEKAAVRLTSAIAAMAHGHAVLLLEGSFATDGPAAANQAAAATLALVAGRKELTES